MATGMESVDLPLVVIVGPTASGKTSLAIRLAQKFGGEIICADSRTIYRDMDIGTAKPTKEEQAIVPHWGINLVDPGERFTAADFKRYALEKIADIRLRGRTPFLVGGTGLYVDAVLFDYQFGTDGNLEQRQELEKLSNDELLRHCLKNNITLPENTHNKRHLIRAIEQGGVNKQRKQAPVSLSVIVGIATETAALRTRIAHRSEQLFTNGVVEEAILLGKKYGWGSEAMTGNIYPLIRSHLLGQRSLDEVKDNFTTLDWQLAKRQLTWFRRNPHILWLTHTDAEAHLSDTLAT